MRAVTWWRIVLSLALVAVGSAGAQRLPEGLGKVGFAAAPPGEAYAYVERFDGTDAAAVFEGLLTVGSEAPWTGTLTGEHYRLENTTAPGAVRYHYLAFVLTDAGYALFVRGADGLSEAMTGTSDAIVPGGRNRLTVRTFGSETSLEVNGEHVAGIDFGRPPSGGIGIVALGAGTFAFAGFANAAP